jgi:hypothetical protein
LPRRLREVRNSETGIPRIENQEAVCAAESAMLYKLARFLQLLGLLIAPTGIAGNVVRPEDVDVKTSLGIAALGVGIFAIGWLLQQGARPS